MKVSKLEGAKLDYWVAKALGYRLSPDGKCWDIPVTENMQYFSVFVDKWKPSINWEQGGPIKEKHRISTAYIDGYVRAIMPAQDVSCPGEGHTWPMLGSTELEAAMRCLVASKYGDEVSDETESA